MNRTTPFVFVTLTLAGCIDNVSSTTGTGTPPISIAGPWAYVVDISATTMNAFCHAKGTFTVNQNAGGFNGFLTEGTQTCTSDAGTDGEQPLFLNFSNGEISGLAVRFVSPACIYLGAADSLVRNITGTASCTVTLPAGGGPAQLTGNWHLSR